MDWRELPSLNSLRAFCAVAETGSYSRAGTALNVSHAAVSQQIKGLEAHLGLALVERAGRGIVLTEDGAALARDLTAGFAAIRRGVEQVTGTDADRPVQITTSPAFAVKWLMPRLADFQLRYPGITLLLNPTSEVVEPRPGGIDLAIRYSNRDTAPPDADSLLVSDMVVVGMPALLGQPLPSEPADLTGLPWLQELGTTEVADWMARHGVAPERRMSITHMPGNLIQEAVKRGAGVTYTARAFLAAEIDSGELVELFAEPAFGVYHMKTRPGVLRPPVRTVITWLKRQAEAPVTYRR